MPKPLRYLLIPLLLLGCADAAPTEAETAEGACVKQGYTLETPAFAQCVTREKGVRRLEDFRKENEQMDYQRELDRVRQF